MKSIVDSGSTAIFVSHNLGAVAELCPRSLLMKGGRLIEDGPTPEVIRSYMQHVSAVRTIAADKPLTIESLAVSDQSGARLNYKPGDELFVDVTLRASKAIKNVSCVLYIKDRQHYTIFNTSPDRLGMELLRLEAGETCTYRFKMKAHLAPGAFHICISCLQHETSNSLDVVEPGVTILIEAPDQVGGSANLYPVASFLKSPGAAVQVRDVELARASG
jgi:hypothetical protein